MNPTTFSLRKTTAWSRFTEHSSQWTRKESSSFQETGYHRSKQTLAFSICTEGPHLELWAHYTTLQEGMRNYNMSILRTCHTSILGGVTEFLMAMENVMKWASVDFVKDIVEQLVLVEKATREPDTINSTNNALS